MITLPEHLPIQYACYFSRSRAGEQFIPEHVLAYVLSGTMEICDVNGTIVLNTGDAFLCRRNHLARYFKQPGEQGEYRSISIYFDQEVLRQFSIEYQMQGAQPVVSGACIPLKDQPLLSTYMESLRTYETLFNHQPSSELIGIKRKEALLLLLELYPSFKHILFDFAEPHKIDLEAFMNRNFTFNVDLKRFAYLTGRSLSTFKRDFEKIFHTTPSRWLLQRRLQEAYHLIKDQKKIASDIYLDLGFEDLSHFSFTFKKKFGLSPTAV